MIYYGHEPWDQRIHKAGNAVWITPWLNIMYVVRSMGILDFNIWRSQQNDHRRKDDIFKCIFLKDDHCILVQISLQFARTDPIDIDSVLMPEYTKHLPEAILVHATEKYQIRPQWVKQVRRGEIEVKDRDIITWKSITVSVRANENYFEKAMKPG